MPNTVERAVEDGEPSLPTKRFGDVQLGFPHQASQVLPGRQQIRFTNPVRLPAPAPHLVGQGYDIPAREDGCSPDRHAIDYRRCVVGHQYCASRPTPGEPGAHFAVVTGVRQPRLGTHRPIHECKAVGTVMNRWAMAHKGPIVLHKLAGKGEVRRILDLESGSVCRVERIHPHPTGAWG